MFVKLSVIESLVILFRFFLQCHINSFHTLTIAFCSLRFLPLPSQLKTTNAAFTVNPLASCTIYRFWTQSNVMFIWLLNTLLSTSGHGQGQTWAMSTHNTTVAIALSMSNQPWPHQRNHYNKGSSVEVNKVEWLGFWLVKARRQYPDDEEYRTIQSFFFYYPSTFFLEFYFVCLCLFTFTYLGGSWGIY